MLWGPSRGCSTLFQFALCDVIEEIISLQDVQDLSDNFRLALDNAKNEVRTPLLPAVDEAMVVQPTQTRSPTRLDSLDTDRELQDGLQVRHLHVSAL